MAELTAKKKTMAAKTTVNAKKLAQKLKKPEVSLPKYTGWIAFGFFFFVFLLSQWFDAAFSWLMGGLVLLMGFIGYDILQRRKWEDNMSGHIKRLASDYERLVREVARNRNDIATLRKGLSDAGEAVRLQDRGKAAEGRMIRAIADKLGAVGGKSRTAVAPDVPEPKIEPVGTVPIGRDEGEFVASQISDDVVLELIRHAVRYDKVEMFMQPVVTLPQRKTRYYEVFSRLRAKAGLYLPAQRYIAVAGRHGLVAAVDNLLLLRCLQKLGDMESNQQPESFFVNIAGMTLNDSKFMGDLVEFISQHRTLAARLIFELTQADLQSLDVSVLPVMDGLSKLGCRFSVDGVRNLSVDLSTLTARHIRFVKLDSAALLKAIETGGGLRRLRQLKSELDRQGIDLIVEKIETEKDLVELLDLDVDFGQGYLFGKPEIQEEAA